MLCRHEQLLWQHHHSNSISLSQILSCHAIQASELCFGNQTRYLRATQLHRSLHRDLSANTQLQPTLQLPGYFTSAIIFISLPVPRSCSIKPFLCFAKTISSTIIHIFIRHKENSEVISHLVENNKPGWIHLPLGNRCRPSLVPWPGKTTRTRNTQLKLDQIVSF